MCDDDVCQHCKEEVGKEQACDESCAMKCCLKRGSRDSDFLGMLDRGERFRQIHEHSG